MAEHDCMGGWRLAQERAVALVTAEVERDRYRAALEEIADGPDRHDAVRSIKTAKRALGHRASPAEGDYDSFIVRRTGERLTVRPVVEAECCQCGFGPEEHRALDGNCPGGS